MTEESTTQPETPLIEFKIHEGQTKEGIPLGRASQAARNVIDPAELERRHQVGEKTPVVLIGKNDKNETVEYVGSKIKFDHNPVTVTHIVIGGKEVMKLKEPLTVEFVQKYLLGDNKDAGKVMPASSKKLNELYQTIQKAMDFNKEASEQETPLPQSTRPLLLASANNNPGKEIS